MTKRIYYGDVDFAYNVYLCSAISFLLYDCCFIFTVFLCGFCTPNPARLAAKSLNLCIVHCDSIIDQLHNFLQPSRIIMVSNIEWLSLIFLVCQFVSKILR